MKVLIIDDEQELNLPNNLETNKWQVIAYCEDKMCKTYALQTDSFIREINKFKDELFQMRCTAKKRIRRNNRDDEDMDDSSGSGTEEEYDKYMKRKLFQENFDLNIYTGDCNPIMDRNTIQKKNERFYIRLKSESL